MQLQAALRTFWDTIPLSFNKSMLGESPKPRFEHRPVRGMLPRMESYCLNCGKFVAGSESMKVLMIAEKAHICPMHKK